MIRLALPTRQRGPAGMRGSIILPAAVAVVVSLVLLASADVGYLFYLKRELQKSADLAAVAGAQVLGITPIPGGAQGAFEGRCASQGETMVEQSARHIAHDNARTGLSGTEGLVVGVQCGFWDLRVNAQSPVSAFGDADPNRPRRWHWRDRVNQELEAPNAVWVTLSHRANGIFGLSWRFIGDGVTERSVTVHAVALKETSFASFSVGSRLLDVKEGAVSQLLRTVGVDPITAGILSYEGLAKAKLTPAGLLNALGIPVNADVTVAEFERLLALKDVSLGRLIDATVTAAGQSGLLSANAKLLREISAKVPQITPGTIIQLGSSEDKRGVFARIDAPPSATAGSALWTEVNALSFLTAVVGVATTRHGAELPVTLSLPGLLEQALKVNAVVIAPPTVAIGGVGTKADNAQIRLSTELCVGCGGLVGNLLGLVAGTQIRLPVHLDVTTASAQLEQLSCEAPSRAKFDVVTSTARLCLGRLVSPSGGVSMAASCATDLKPEKLVSLLHLTILEGSLSVPVGQSPAIGPAWITAGETARFVGNVYLDQTTTALTKGVVDLLPTGGLLNWLVIGPVVHAVSPLLGPLLKGVSDLLVTTVLDGVLGITLNSADVHLASVGCRHNARLVY